MRLVVLLTLMIALFWSSLAASQALRVRTVATGYNGSGGVAVLANGDILVADFGSSLNSANGTQVLRFTPDGMQSVYATGLAGASGNALAANGNLIQSNIASGSVVSITPDGAVNSISSGIATPIGVAVKADGSIYVASCGSNQIMRANPGSAATAFSTGILFSCPNGLTVDDRGDLYAVNFRGGGMVRIDAAGNATAFATIPGSGNGHITFGNNHFYVVSNRSNRIYQVTREGEVSLLAGSGRPGVIDGPPEDARFTRPNGIAISPDGRTLYVSQKAGTTSSGTVLHPNVLRAIDLDRGEPQLTINVGLRGSWYDTATPGQGILIDLVAGRDELFAAWYSFIAGNESADPSGNDQRWYSLQGNYSGNRANLLIFENLGGRFDDSAPVSTTAIGTFDLDFVNCTHAVANYEFTEPARSGSISLTRLSPDVLCADLAR